MDGTLSAPRATDRAAFTIVGMCGEFSPESAHEIGALWGRFVERIDEVGGAVRGACYGLCVALPGAPSDGACSRFEYTAGIESAGGAPVPHGMVAREVPAQSYLVFTYAGHVSGLAAAFERIFRTEIVAAGREPAPGPDFELYDARFDGATASGEVEIWVPVKPR